MATYNSVIYASAIANPSTGVGSPAANGLTGLQFQDADINGGTVKQSIVQFSTSSQSLNIGDTIYLMILPAYSRVIRITLINDTATSSGAIQIGAIINGTVTGGYYSSSGISIGTANSKSDALTNLANLGNESPSPITVAAAIQGANVSGSTNLTFIFEYTTNS